jgi:hypothetical protein
LERGVRGVDPSDIARPGSAVNLAHLLCGSEGTLAVTLGGEPEAASLPRQGAGGRRVRLDLDDAIDAVMPILSTGPSAVELLDDTVIDLARANTEYRTLRRPDARNRATAN